MGRFRTPGPGAYDIPSHLSIGASIDCKPTSTFASNSSRSSRSTGASGGDPGAYDIERGGVHMGKKEPLSSRSRRSHNREIHQGKGSFTSHARRSTSAPPRSMRGGPGEHDYSHLFSCGRNSQQVTSAFMSSVPLGGHVRNSDTPGVGEYDTNDKERFQSKSFTKQGSHMFAGAAKSRSLAANSATGKDIGPGSYELSSGSIEQRMAKTTNTRLPGFGSSSVRVGLND